MAYAAGAGQAGASRSLKAAIDAARVGVAGRKPCIGTWMTLPGARLGAMLASTGVDWVLLDSEHGAIADTELHAAIPAIANAGSSPVVRLPAGEMHLIKRALDAGAHGIMIPMVETKEQAEQLVRWSKFPPWGTRGVGSPFAQQAFGISPAAYLQTANDITTLIVQIETPLGVKNVKEIAAVEGVDILFVGPYDLATSMGMKSGQLPVDVAGVPEAISSVLEAAHGAGKAAGIYTPGGDAAAARFKEGFEFVNAGSELTGMLTWIGTEAAKIRAAAKI